MRTRALQPMAERGRVHAPSAEPRRNAQDTRSTFGNRAVLRAVVQRKCACGSGAECVCDDKMRAQTQRDGREDLPPRIADVPEIASSTGSPLPATMRERTEDFFGANLDNVRVHIDEPAARAAARMGANAFTAGNDIFFAGGHPPAGRLLGHELAHVLQQRAGASAEDKTSELRLERDADAAAAAFVTHAPVPFAMPAAGDGHSDFVQRQVAEPHEEPKDDRRKVPEPKSWTGAAKKCGEDFCRPLPWAVAIAQRELYWPVFRAGIAYEVTPIVVPIWDLWAYGGTSLQNFDALFGKDFENSDTTIVTTEFLVEALKANLTANPPVIAPGGAIARNLSELIPDAVKKIDTPGEDNYDRMNFYDLHTVPGNLAGDFGNDESANPVGAKPSTVDEKRIAQGFVIISDEGGETLKVSPYITYTVIDTVDLCPGDCGAKIERIATIPMSRWEATGISGDVPFTVSFPGNAAPFTIPKPGKTK